MSYVIPSVLVYQQLENSGGVLNSTPDLEACIVGPLNNVVDFIPDSAASLASTLALSAVETTGDVTAGSKTVSNVADPAPGEYISVTIKGAGVGGGDLVTTVVTDNGSSWVLSDAASTTVVGARILKPAALEDPSVETTVAVNSAYPGQIIDLDTVKVWFTGAVKTISSMAWGYTTGNELTFATGSSNTTTGSTTSVINLAASPLPGVNRFAVGDTVTIPGVGVASGLYTGVITDVDYSLNQITVSPATASTVGSGIAVTKVGTLGRVLPSLSPKIEVGDQFTVTNINTPSTPILTGTVHSVLLNGNNEVVSFTAVDMLTAAEISIDAPTTATGTTNDAGDTTINVTSSAQFSVGDKIVIKNGAANNGTLITTVSSIPDGISIVIANALGQELPAGSAIYSAQYHRIDIIKEYSNQLVPATRPISGGNQIDLTDVVTLGDVTIEANPELGYGALQYGDFYISYSALRTDKATTVLSIEDIADAEGQLGNLTDDNPLGLGVSIALANTVGRVRAVAIGSNDLVGYLNALNLIEGERVYFITPLTQDTSIIAAVKAHVDQMSTPEMASWRTAIVNTAIPSSLTIGSATADVLNVNGGANTITNIGGFWTLTSSNSTFVSNGVTPGDLLNVSDGAGGFDSYVIDTIVNNQQLILAAGSVSSPASAVEFYVSRSMTKTQQAQYVAATSEQFNDKRVWHVQPDYVGITINGVIKKLPGYYLCCGLAGMGAGFPVQQGFTNIGVAGISDLYNSNYYFSRTDLNAMAEKGTLLFVQATQKGIPYVRHELTTDISTLEYREVLVVKNWDFLSYYYHDKLKPFIGSWNITPDTMNIIRQTIVASSELLLTKKLPKIGPPLLGYNINSIAQDANNKDNLNVNLQIQVVYPLNYLNLYLII